MAYEWSERFSLRWFDRNVSAPSTDFPVLENSKELGEPQGPFAVLANTSSWRHLGQSASRRPALLYLCNCERHNHRSHAKK